MHAGSLSNWGTPSQPSNTIWSAWPGRVSWMPDWEMNTCCINTIRYRRLFGERLTSWRSTTRQHGERLCTSSQTARDGRCVILARRFDSEGETSLSFLCFAVSNALVFTDFVVLPGGRSIHARTSGLFFAFALAFWILAIDYAVLGVVAFATESRVYVFLFRLLAFGLILARIVDKNRRRTQ